MKFSIITVNYNNKEGLRETIESVKGLSSNNYEYIIIDGGSTDGSVDVIKEHQNSISFWVSEKDDGIYNAMNKGIRQAKGEYINFMNSGDTYYTPDVLSLVEKELEDYDIVVGKEFHQNPKTGATATTFLPMRLSMATFVVSFLPHQGGFIRHTLFDDMLYDESLKIVSDWKFYMLQIVYKNRKVKLINTVICQREQGGISNTGTSLNKKERTQVLNTLLPPGVWKDYESLSRLDKTTMYKFLNMCDDKKTLKLLKYSIKIIYRIRKYLQ